MTPELRSKIIEITEDLITFSEAFEHLRESVALLSDMADRLGNDWCELREMALSDLVEELEAEKSKAPSD